MRCSGTAADSPTRTLDDDPAPASGGRTLLERGTARIGPGDPRTTGSHRPLGGPSACRRASACRLSRDRAHAHRSLQPTGERRACRAPVRSTPLRDRPHPPDNAGPPGRRTAGWDCTRRGPDALPVRLLFAGEAGTPASHRQHIGVTSPHNRYRPMRSGPRASAPDDPEVDTPKLRGALSARRRHPILTDGKRFPGSGVVPVEAPSSRRLPRPRAEPLQIRREAARAVDAPRDGDAPEQSGSTLPRHRRSASRRAGHCHAHNTAVTWPRSPRHHHSAIQGRRTRQQ